MFKMDTETDILCGYQTVCSNNERRKQTTTFLWNVNILLVEPGTNWTHWGCLNLN